MVAIFRKRNVGAIWNQAIFPAALPVARVLHRKGGHITVVLYGDFLLADGIRIIPGNRYIVTQIAEYFFLFVAA